MDYEFKFYHKKKNEIFAVTKIEYEEPKSVAFNYHGQRVVCDIADGVLLPVLDLQLSDGTPYTQGDVIFLTNDDELYLRLVPNKGFIDCEEAKRHPRHLFTLMRGELGYWWLYGSDGKPTGHNDEMYPAGWIEAECDCYRVKDSEGRNVNIYTHRDGLFPGVGGFK